MSNPYKLSTDEVRMWLQRIKASIVWRKPEQDKWERYIGYLRNKFIDVKDDDDYICVNLVHSSVRVIIPATYSKNPDLIVKARRKEYRGLASCVNDVLKYYIDELGLKDELKMVLLDTILCGRGWIKEGYQTDFADAGQDPNAKTAIQKLIDSLKKVVSGGKDALDPEEEYALAMNCTINEEAPWIERASPFDIIVPAFTRDERKMPWITERFVQPLIDFKNNPEYDNTKDLKPSANAYALLQSRDKGDKAMGVMASELPDEESEYVIGYNITCRRTGRVYVLAEDHDKALQVKDNAYSFLNNKHNYRSLAFNTVPDEFYPMSDIEPWEPQLLELNKTRTQQVRHRRRFNRRYIAKDQAFQEAELTKITEGADGSVALTTEENVQNSIMPLPDATMSADVYNIERVIKDDINIIGGISGYQRGSLASGAKTATEASIVDNNSRFRSDERLDIMGTFALNVCRDIALLCLRWLPVEEVAKIVGMEEAAPWVNLDDEGELRKEFYFDMTMGSTAPVNREVDRQQMLGLYQITSQDPSFDILTPRVELLKSFGIKDPESWLNQQLIPLLLQRRMAEAQQPVEGPEGATEQPADAAGTEAPPPIGTPPQQAALDGVPSSASIMGGPRMQAGVPMPGGPGGQNLVQ